MFKRKVIGTYMWSEKAQAQVVHHTKQCQSNDKPVLSIPKKIIIVSNNLF